MFLVLYIQWKTPTIIVVNIRQQLSSWISNDICCHEYSHEMFLLRHHNVWFVVKCDDNCRREYSHEMLLSDIIMSELSCNIRIYNMIQYTSFNIHQCWLQTSHFLSRLVTFEYTWFTIHFQYTSSNRCVAAALLNILSFSINYIHWLPSALLKALWSHHVIIFCFFSHSVKKIFSPFT